MVVGGKGEDLLAGVVHQSGTKDDTVEN